MRNRGELHSYPSVNWRFWDLISWSMTISEQSSILSAPKQNMWSYINSRSVCEVDVVCL
jgi:hypothetical protein